MPSLTTRQKIGVRMHHWHASSSDPVYAVGSYFYMDKKYPTMSVVADARDTLESLLDRGRLSVADARKLRTIIQYLDKELLDWKPEGRSTGRASKKPGRAGGRATYRKGYGAVFPEKVRDAITKEYHHTDRVTGAPFMTYSTSPDYSGKLASIVGRRIVGDRIPKDLEGTWTAPNGVRIRIERATGAHAQHRLFVWCSSCQEWIPYGRVAQHSGGNKHQSTMRRPGQTKGAKKPGHSSGHRIPYRTNYSEWLGEVDSQLVKAGFHKGIDDLSKTWLRVQFRDGEFPSAVVARVKSHQKALGLSKGRAKKAGCGCKKGK